MSYRDWTLNIFFSTIISTNGWNRIQMSFKMHISFILHENIPFPLHPIRRYTRRRARHRQKLNIAQLSKVTAVRSGGSAVSCCGPSNRWRQHNHFPGSHMPGDLTAVAPSVSAILTVSGPSPADLTGKCELRFIVAFCTCSGGDPHALKVSDVDV